MCIASGDNCLRKSPPLRREHLHSIRRIRELCCGSGNETWKKEGCLFANGQLVYSDKCCLLYPQKLGHPSLFVKTWVGPTWWSWVALLKCYNKPEIEEVFKQTTNYEMRVYMQFCSCIAANRSSHRLDTVFGCSKCRSNALYTKQKRYLYPLCKMGKSETSSEIITILS